MTFRYPPNYHLTVDVAAIGWTRVANRCDRGNEVWTGKDGNTFEWPVKDKASK